jgi:agmatine/peptidylarginine deiminase
LKYAKDVNGKPYKLVHLPLTKQKCVIKNYGFYINYYVGNEVVLMLMPSFDGDPNDEAAKNILQ